MNYLQLARRATRFILAFALVAGITVAAQIPRAHAGDAAKSHGRESVVLAGGCFWGMEAVFGALAGVERVVPGYSGGDRASAHYEIVSTGTTGHAESVEIVYDPTRISFRRLLDVFFLIAHDPTQRDRQGPDVGRQYRSAIFYRTEEQRSIAAAYVRALDEGKTLAAPVATSIEPLRAFYPAEEYHRHYVARHPADPYVAFNDLPKLARLRERFPGLVASAPN